MKEIQVGSLVRLTKKKINYYFKYTGIGNLPAGFCDKGEELLSNLVGVVEKNEKIGFISIKWIIPENDKKEINYLLETISIYGFLRFEIEEI